MSARPVPDPEPPRYPALRVSIRSPKPLALVAAVREELRLAGAGRGDIERFTERALSHAEDPAWVRRVAESWVGTIEAA